MLSFFKPVLTLSLLNIRLWMNRLKFNLWTSKVVFLFTTDYLRHNETDADANGRFIGVYEKKTFTKDEADAGIYYGWADGKFKRAGEGAKVDACRAYLKLPAKVAGRAPASLSVKFDGDGTTGIGTAKSNADGGAEAPMYNLQGQRVGAGYKGLVIKNGRMVIVK